MRMPPGRAAFTLEEGRAGVLMAGPSSTLAARLLDVVLVKFRIVDLG